MKEDDGTVPEDWLDTDIKQGISDSDVEHRRKRFGWNELASEKENLFIKFLMFFTGPILYGESSTASRRLPVHPHRGLRMQWFDAAYCFDVAISRPCSSAARAHEAWLELCLASNTELS